jgi:signal transduction histidine kinase
MPLRSVSLSWKILLGVVPLMLISLTISVFVQNRFQEEEMMEQAQVSAHTYADLIRESLVSQMVYSQEIDTTYVDRVNRIRHFDSLGVLANDLHLREELLSEERLSALHAKVRPTPLQDSVQAGVFAAGQPAFMRSGDQFRAVIPFNATKVCQKCHAVPLEYTLGAADVRFSLARFTDATRGNWRRSVIIFVIFTVVAVGLAVLVFRRTVAGPMDRLVKATTAMQKGDLTVHASAPGTPGDPRRDELGVLAEHFDEMRESLADKIASLDQVNRDLVRRNKDLEDAMDRLRRTQEELVRSERLAVTGKMAAQLSHEINNPIHNTRSLLESSLRRMQPNDQAHELISLAIEEVTRMATLTRQLLDVYRGSVAETAMRPVDLASLVTEMERAHHETFASRGIRLSSVIAEPVSPICGSRDKLKQVLLNLLLNARDAMPGGGTLVMGLMQDGERAVLSVRDSGTGIAPEHLPRIFDAFFTTKSEVSGVGLGLSVSYGIIQQHQGTIDVKSVPGSGTEFIIRLPVVRTGEGVMA